MTQLHAFVQTRWAFGYAEPGESCRGCKRRLALYESCLVLRLLHHETGAAGPPAGNMCHTCALLQGIRPGDSGAEHTRLDALGHDLEALTRQFWAGLRDSAGYRVQFHKKVF